MARPLKSGIDYYSTDVNILDDDKLLDLFDEFGTSKGCGLLTILLVYIYKNNGYFTEWNKSICKKIARRTREDINDVQKTVEILAGVDREYKEDDQSLLFFNQKLFKNEGILTSEAIQKRFFVATMRRTERVIIKQYLLLPYDKGMFKVPKKVDGQFTKIDEESYFVTLEKKQIPITFAISGLICEDVDNKEVNVNINYDNVCTSTQTKGNQTETILNQTEIGNQTEKESILNGNQTEKDNETEIGNQMENYYSSYSPLESLFTESVKYWNENINLDGWVRCRYTGTMTIPTNKAVEIKKKFDLFSIDEIKEAVDNLVKCWNRIPAQFRLSTYDGLMGKIESWTNEAKPCDRYPEVEIKRKYRTAEERRYFTNALTMHTITPEELEAVKQVAIKSLEAIGEEFIDYDNR